MNIDHNYSKININKVRSKHFTIKHMDDSLTDFQESKKINSGPKISKIITKTSRKTSKRIKGQKDIRSALKGKKDELVEYTKKFDTICRTSGIDVDPEELQLAITLSKSLETEPLKDENTSNIYVNTQDKIKRIRNTLQEYGFKVPESKITTKRVRKNRNNHELLSYTDVKRLQVISDRFAQVLLNSVNNFKTNTIFDLSKSPLYYIATNVCYEEIKDDEIFCVNALKIDTTKRIGSLLRNWAEIPGRPLSPVNIDYFEMNFTEIECSQDELDLALSGPLISIKHILKSKQNKNTNKNIYTPETNKKLENISEDTNLEIPSNIAKIDLGSQLLQDKYRSGSPDIFEDEISTAENTKNDITIYDDKLSNGMDLTECVNVNTNIVTQIVNKKTDLHNLSKCDLTRRKSDDAMEITECVASTSGFKNVFIQNHAINLTQNEENPEITSVENGSGINNIDLTQSSNSSDDLPIVHLPDKYSEEDTIIINVCDYENIVNTRKMRNAVGTLETFDLTSDVNEEKKSSKGFFEDYLYCHSDYSEEQIENKYTDKNDNKSDGNKMNEELEINVSTNLSNELNFKTAHEVLYKVSSSTDGRDNKIVDLISIEVKKPAVDIINNMCETVNDDTNFHKITGLRENKDCEWVDKVEGSEVIIVENEHFKNDTIHASYSNLNNNTKVIEEEIDLTQHSPPTVRTSSQNIDGNSLGKKDNVSIDYDDISNHSKQHSIINGIASVESPIYEIADEFEAVDKVTNHSESDDALGLSQRSEVFEIIDNELNYSLFQSRHENFNTSGISANNEFSISQKLCKDDNLVQKHQLIGYNNDLVNLPEIELEGTQQEPSTASSRTDNKNVNHLETPKSNCFVIKTNEVTPMKDFAAMSTPERNKELDKYGIKPFKRKRAIQLLTYIYNQTHPTIHDNLDCLQSSPKKLKPNTLPRNSPKKLASPSPKKIHIQNVENNENIFEVTNEVPIIRDLECSVEDWVFQKREKAKVQSCRVPLHVAFHNYVSCRRGLREAILRYEPVNIDVIHKELVAYGHRYDPKDLLKFMDKKCITVKTADNNGRNNRN